MSWGLGGSRGIRTERQLNPLTPNTTRTFSLVGD